MRLERMSCEAAKSYFAKDDTVIFAIGSIENHGSHNVLGVDYIIPTHLLDLIEKQSDVLIAPPIPYGACDTLADFPGTVSLGQDVLCMVINKIVEGLYNHGARRFLFLNGH
ncbi:MAG: creatininase family protein, partial [Clostridiales bacterium]|nr:creatininase family protein [Clostridiales bacterium]